MSVDATWKAFIRREAAFDFNWHYHREYEVTLITQGSGVRYVGTSIEAYKPGQLVLIGPDVPHTFSSRRYASEVAEAAVAQFRHDFLGSGFFDLPQFADIAALLAQSSAGLLISVTPEPIQRLMARLPALPPAARTAGLLDLLDRLTRCPQRRLTQPGYVPTPGAIVSDRIDMVCAYLQQSHAHPITLDEVAQVASMSPTSFSRFFRQTMGRTFTDYVNQLRIETSCRLLTDTDLPITTVASSSGFANLANFNRRFRQLRHMSPREYRKAHRPDMS